MVTHVACVRGIRQGLHAFLLFWHAEAERYSFGDSEELTDLHCERLRCCDG